MSKQSNQRYRKEREKQNSSASNSYKDETSSCYDKPSNRYEYDTEDFHISNTDSSSNATNNSAKN